MSHDTELMYYPGYNANQRSLLVNGRTQMNGNLTINGNISVNSPNIALGFQAGNTNQGSNSVAIGAYAGNTSQGAQSVAIGYQSAYNQTGINNTFVGQGAGGTYLATGASNTFIGSATVNTGATAAGYNNTTLGAGATVSTSYGNTTAIGVGATATASNQIVLGTTNDTVRLNTITPMYSTPSFTAGMIGFINSTGVTSPIPTGGSVLAYISNIPPGVYIISYYIGVNGGQPAQYFQFLCGVNGLNSSEIHPLIFNYFGGTYHSITPSVTYVNTATTTFSLTGGASGSSLNLYNGKFQVTRIA